jgi:hypothetical protein
MPRPKMQKVLTRLVEKNLALMIVADLMWMLPWKKKDLCSLAV